MLNETKLLELSNNLYSITVNRFKSIKKNFLIYIVLLLLGFICGSLFGTFLIFFRSYTDWDGFIILITVMLIEFVNVLIYVKSSKNKRYWYNNKLYNNRNIVSFYKELK